MPGVNASDHPAPVPLPDDITLFPSILIPRKPALHGSITPEGIVLKISNHNILGLQKLEVFYYEQTDVTPDISVWEKYAETYMTTHTPVVLKFENRSRYRQHFIVRGVSINGIYGFFSDPVSL